MAILPTILPRLHGAWLMAFRAAWCIAFVITFFSTIGATWIDASAPAQASWQTLTEREYGHGVRIFGPIGPRPWSITTLFSTEAAASGLQVGDQVIAFNGHAVAPRTPPGVVALSLSAQEGARTLVRVRSADGSTSDHVLTFHNSNIEAWYRGSGLNPWRQFLLRRIAYDVMTLLLLAVSAILFLRRSHEAVAAAFSLGLCLIPIGATVDFWTSIGAYAFYQYLAAFPYILILMVGCAFPDGRYWPAWTRFGLIAAPAVLTPAISFGSEYGQFLLFTAPAFLMVIIIMALRYRLLPQGTERQQFRWAAFGFAAGVILLILRFPAALVQSDLGPAPLSAWIDLSASFLHALGYAVIGAGFGVALLKYRLYDAELLISRSAAITAATLMLAGLWAASGKALETFLPNLVGQQYASLAGVFSAGFAVVLVTLAHGRMQQFIEKRFHKGVYRLREDLPKLLDTLTLRFGTSELCAKVLSDIVRDVRVTKAAILVRNEGKFSVAAEHGVDAADLQPWIEAPGEAPANDIEPAIVSVALPLNDPVMDEEVGWLLIGTRPDGTNCNRDERAALAAVAPHIARAIATVQARDRRENR